MSNKKTTKIIVIISICLAILLTVILTCQFVKINNLKTTQNKLETTYSELQNKISEKANQNELLSNDSALDDYAHSALNYSKDSELWFSEK